ncbi:MAG: response regulator transcription factor [Clostridia bacterium]|nr:response regulator transcription factor [Clostridia bacterium]
MGCILVCEDERAIREFVVLSLKRAGFQVLEADSGEAALALFDTAKQPVDIALLDVMLPGVDGFTVCRRLRAQDATVGIVMLTARSQEPEKIEGLHSGADDYVTKPFSLNELLARVQALYRRVQVLRDRADERYLEKIQRGDFTLDLRSRTLTAYNRTVDLTQVEYQILEYFFAHPQVCLKREDILRQVWGETYTGDDKVVDVNIRRLRMKTEKDPSNPRHLLTVWGEGYQWED